jgi:hypothetical protein
MAVFCHIFCSGPVSALSISHLKSYAGLDLYGSGNGTVKKVNIVLSFGCILPDDDTSGGAIRPGMHMAFQAIPVDGSGLCERVLHPDIAGLFQ